MAQPETLRSSSRSFDPVVVLQTAVEGRFAIDREIGRGGMGIVYLAHDLSLERPVAIKMLPPLAALSAVSRERFIREARITASLSHPNILPVHSFEVSADWAFFVTAFVKGETLEQRVQRTGPLDAEDLMKIVREVAWALEYAHLRGVIHRDIKPGNIMLEEDSGRVLVMDFGIALGQYEPLTEGRLGTRGFASPEQVHGEPVDLRSDLYSLGVTGLYALTGTGIEEQPPDVDGLAFREHRLRVPSQIVATLQRCVAERAEDRPSSAREVVDAMDAGLNRIERIPFRLRSWITEGRGFTIPLLIFMLLPFTDPAWLWTLPYRHFFYALWYGLPWIGIAVFRLGKLWEVTRAGYGIYDLRSALREWTRQRNRDLRTRAQSASPRISALVRGWTTGALTLIAGGYFSLPIFYALEGRTLENLYIVNGALYDALRVGSIGVILLLMGLIVGWVLPTWAPRQQDLLAGLRLRFWDSRLGKWLATGIKLVSQLASRHEQSVLWQGRHTEVMLHSGLLGLFGNLNSTLQAELEGLPGTASRLEQQALELRQSISRLRELESTALPVSTSAETKDHADVIAELASRREAQEAAHKEIIQAIEQLRLGLMRLVSLAEAPGDTLDSLQDAKEYEDMLRLLHDARLAADNLPVMI